MNQSASAFFSTLKPEQVMVHPAWLLGNVLDIRSRDDYLAGHLEPAVSIPVVADEEPADRLPGSFLSPRQEPLLVVADAEDRLQAVCGFLQGRRRHKLFGIVLNAAVLATLPPEAVAVGGNGRHLWRPPAFLQQCAGLLPSPVAGPILDCGAGSCRAAVCMAARLPFCILPVKTIPFPAMALSTGRASWTRGVLTRLKPSDSMWFMVSLRF